MTTLPTTHKSTTATAVIYARVSSVAQMQKGPWTRLAGNALPRVCPHEGL
jgi:hypothetical protein